jgi:hypothetical protein
VLLQALRAARNDVEHPHDQAGHARDDEADPGGQKPPPIRKERAEDLADALVEICAAYLRGKIVSADNADVYQVIIHAGTEAITAGDDVSAETPANPAYPLRCHFEDGGAVSPAALRLIACNATITTMLHDTDGNPLTAGRRTRKPSAALRRAVRERDRNRCRYPGCESRRTDAHHIKHWANGGQTTLPNLISLCKAHHRIVHDKGITITPTPGGGFAFSTPKGVPIPLSPPPPPPAGDITAWHNAKITPDTIVPPFSGERLDLNLAIWVAFANARVKAQRRQAQVQAA